MFEYLVYDVTFLSVNIIVCLYIFIRLKRLNFRDDPYRLRYTIITELLLKIKIKIIHFININVTMTKFVDILSSIIICIFITLSSTFFQFAPQPL